jgi:hypothetical protein
MALTGSQCSVNVVGVAVCCNSKSAQAPERE